MIENEKEYMWRTYVRSYKSNLSLPCHLLPINMQYYPQYPPHEDTHGYDDENIRVSLHNQDLWKQFHDITNEMIVTKVGRRMFPVVAIEVRGLDPDKMYTIELSFEQIDSHRWRYVSAQWQPGLKPDAAINRISYQHPDSPNYGRKWMKDPILFSKVKLTNKVDRADASHILLNSLHKYRPRISIIDVMTKQKIYEAHFVETEFIAVTAYQNDEVKALKIRYNPFAKAFLDAGHAKQEMFDEPMMNLPTFYSHESSAGGPDRLKLQSYRTSPYGYSPRERKISPKEEASPPTASTSSNELVPFHNPLTSATNGPCSSDPNNYYANYYYPPTDPYYYSYGNPTTASQYSFLNPFNYGSSDPSASFLHFQQPFLPHWDSTDYSNASAPVTTKYEES